MMKIPLSLVIITQNEESNIERCIRSVPFASEVVVVDSGSRDRTCEVAESLGAKVFRQNWLGYGPQKRFATGKASYDWILSLDADEALSKDAADEIQANFQSLDPQTGYELPRKSFHLGRWIRHGGWYPDYQLRLFNRQFSNWPDSQIHERVQASKTQTLENPILHFVFPNLSAQVETNNKYSSLLSEKDYHSGKAFSFLRLLLKPWSKFFECYFLKLGFLDGLPGFIIAVSAAYSIFLRLAKRWEFEMRKQKGISQ